MNWQDSMFSLSAQLWFTDLLKDVKRALTLTNSYCCTINKNSSVVSANALYG